MPFANAPRIIQTICRTVGFLRMFQYENAIQHFLVLVHVIHSAPRKSALEPRSHSRFLERILSIKFHGCFHIKNLISFSQAFFPLRMFPQNAWTF